MKSLQNQYNLIKEGKGNKEIFLKEVKAQFPQYITNVQTFDQVIHSLTEKGIINETITLVTSNTPIGKDWFKVFKENTENVKAELKDTDKEVVEKETAGYDYKAKNNNNISTAEMLKGYYVEMKDPKNAEKTEDQIKAIVVKNLEKDPLFYVKDGEFGIRGVGYSSEHPGLPKDIYGNYALGIEPKVKLTGKYKSSGMEPVNLNEAKKRTIEKHIAEIEKMGEVAAWGHRIGKIQEKIDELTNKMTVTEGDDVKDMVDKKAVKELKKDIALLTKKKALYEKQKTKAAGRVKDKSAMQTAAGEGTTVMEKEEKPFTPPTDPIGDRIKASMKRDTAPKPKKESWSGMVRELINTKNLKVK
jgi:hypothetical protein